MFDAIRQRLTIARASERASGALLARRSAIACTAGEERDTQSQALPTQRRAHIFPSACARGLWNALAFDVACCVILARMRSTRSAEGGLAALRKQGAAVFRLRNRNRFSARNSKTKHQIS